MRPFLECGGKLRELAEDHTAMPLGARDVDFIFAIGRLGGQREGGKATGAVVAQFRIAADETHEGDFVLVHIVVLRLEFAPPLIGALGSEWAMLPSAEALHLRRVRRNLFAAVGEQDFAGNRNPQGGAAEAEERVAAGRMRSPERCPNQGRSNASENTGTRQISLGLPASQSTAHRS